MRSFRDYPLKHKLVGIILLASIVALLLACLIFIAYEQVTFRRTMVRDTSILADVIQDNVGAALTFNDATVMEKGLQSMRAQPRILAGAVYDKAGKRVATYERSRQPGAFPWPASAQVGSSFQADRLDTFQSITLAGEAIGTLYIASDLSELEERQARYALIGGVALLLSAVASWLLAMRLQRVISEPLLNLAQTATRVTTEKNYALRATKHGQDELGSLVDRFNEMLAQIERQELSLREANEQLEQRVAERTRELENLHRQLVDASRRGGMAEIATNVLHNVGNVLNSVNVSAGLITESVKKSRASSLARVVVLLQEHAHDLGEFITNDARGKHLPAHLAQLSEHLLADQQAMVGELAGLRRNIEHIKEIVAMQQNYAKVGGVKEMINVTSLVEDSLHMNESGLGRHGVEVIREFEKVPPMNVEKHKILQILVNLMRNAKYACDESKRADKRMTVRVADGDGRVKISVMDNGVGIPPENLTRIFNHGFTTRKDGHGFGLHSGALAAREMGGSLTVHSDGLGHGATFTLELPLPDTGKLT